MSLRPPVLSKPEFLAALKKRPKYGVSDPVKRTYSGKVYMSHAEAKYAAELDLKKRAGLIRDWRSQVPFQIVVNGHKICKVIIDFAVDELNGTTRYVELKGVELDKWKLKEKLLRACYPETVLDVLKVRR